MKVALVVAFSENYVIGKDGKIPWKLKDDMRYFKELTTGNPIIMGRKTYESIGKPLPNRTNIVISSRSRTSTTKNLVFVSSFAAALETAKHHLDETKQTCYVIGGARVYREAVPHAHALYISHVHTCVRGDTFFPEVIDWREWDMKFATDYQAEDGRNDHSFTLILYERRSE